MIDARYTAARQTDQSGGRGWSFDPYAEPAFSVIRVLELLFRPSSLASLAILGLCVALLVAF